MQIYEQHGLEVIHVSKCSSIAHVIAAIALEFSKVGRPPEVIFGWSHESPLAANLNFLFFGQGNVPWMVQELVRRVEPDEAKCPRVVIG
jgi:Co/Zn/Cd efflux system component